MWAMETRREKLGAAVHEARASLRLTQNDLAAKAGISRMTLVKVEQGKPEVRLLTLACVEAALGWPGGTVTDFLRGRRVEAPTPEPAQAALSDPTPTLGDIENAVLLAAIDAAADELTTKQVKEIAKRVAEALSEQGLVRGWQINTAKAMSSHAVGPPRAEPAPRGGIMLKFGTGQITSPNDQDKTPLPPRTASTLTAQQCDEILGEDAEVTEGE